MHIIRKDEQTSKTFADLAVGTIFTAPATYEPRMCLFMKVEPSFGGSEDLNAVELYEYTLVTICDGEPVVPYENATLTLE